MTFASIEGIASVQVSTEPLAALEIGVGGQVVTTPYDVDVCTPVQFTALGTYGTNEPKRYITHLVTWEVIHTDSNDPTVTPEPVSRVFNDDAKKGYFGAWATTGAPVKAELKVSLNTIESSLLELNILGSISEININPNGLSIPVSTKHQFTALGKYNTSDSETTDFTDVALWTKDINSNSIDVSTTSPGLVTGVAIGSSPLTVTCGGGTDSVIVTVTESAKMERISIDYTAAEFVTMTQNETVQLKAVAHYSDGRTPEDITENDETSWTVRIIDTDKAQPIIVTSNSSIPDKGNISFNDLGTAIPVGEKRFAEVVVKYSNDLEDDIVVVVTP